MVIKRPFLLLLIFKLSCAFGQVENEIYTTDYEYGDGAMYNLINEHLGEFQTDFEELMTTRGLSEFKSTKFGVEAIESLLANYTENVFDSKTSEKHKTAIVFFHHINDTLFTWVLTSKIILKINCIKAEKFAQLELDLKNSLEPQYGRGVVVSSVGHRNKTNSFDSVSRELGEILFPTKLLNKIKDYEHLLIVPCLNIGSIPLYALKPDPMSDLYLVDQKLITIAHSFDDIRNKVKYQQSGLRISEVLNKNDNSLLGSNDVYKISPKNPLIVGNPSFEGCIDRFSQLSGAEKEAKYVAKKFNSYLLTGTEATKTAVQSQLKSSEFLYFATHGYADLVDPINKSFLVFSSVNKGECSFLNPKEIQNDTISPNSLVVLSACQSGLGRALDAGVIGLGRGFLKAGAGNVIMSLWSVGDQQTQEIMAIFADELFIEKEFLTTSSLRNAILSYKKVNPNPYSWAAFISMGLPIGIKSVYIEQ